jgi:hypothetical protein
VYSVKRVANFGWLFIGFIASQWVEEEIRLVIFQLVTTFINIFGSRFAIMHRWSPKFGFAWRPEMSNEP